VAKQKSGLGRGLNALFDETPRPAAAPAAAEPKKEEAPKAANIQPKAAQAKPADAPKKEQQGVLHQALNQRNAAKKSASNSSNIYISEEALENAKVVSRETRKPVSHPGSGTTARTAPVSKPAVPAAAPVHKAQTNVATSRPAAKSAVPVATSRPATQKPAAPAPKPEVKKVSDEKGSTGVVELAKVQPNPDQPRTNFKPGEIEELADSIKKEGLLQPILVRKVGDHYQIIAGERRWQACKSLDMKEIPVRFWKADNDKALELALIENIQRSDLNPIEEAYGYKRLMERKGMTQSELAKTVSKGRSTIANALRLLDLPEEAQQLLFEDKITAGHARAILSVSDAEGRKKLTNKLMEEKLSVRETEQIARLMSGREQAVAEGKAKRVPTPVSFKKAARGLTRFFSAPVRVKTVQGKNKIEIQFKDEEELQRILNLISESADKAKSESE
jgi:ParB family transcriptional regulator, chromosome partitioning protein